MIKMHQGVNNLINVLLIANNTLQSVSNQWSFLKYLLNNFPEIFLRLMKYVITLEK